MALRVRFPSRALEKAARSRFFSARDGNAVRGLCPLDPPRLPHGRDAMLRRAAAAAFSAFGLCCVFCPSGAKPLFSCPVGTHSYQGTPLGPRVLRTIRAPGGAANPTGSICSLRSHLSALRKRRLLTLFASFGPSETKVARFARIFRPSGNEGCSLRSHLSALRKRRLLTLFASFVPSGLRSRP